MNGVKEWVRTENIGNMRMQPVLAFQNFYRSVTAQIQYGDNLPDVIYFPR